MANPLVSESLLWGMFDQKRWVVTAHEPWWRVLKVPTWEDCCYLIHHFRLELSRLAADTTTLYIEYGDREICQVSTDGELMAQAQTPNSLVPMIGELPFNRELLDVFGMMLSSPESSYGLVRLSDERQISVSGGDGGKFLVGASVAQATQWHRADYWHPEDLTNFNREWVAQMSAGSNRWFEYRYRSFDPMAPSYRRGPQFCDYEFVTQYRLIEGPQGNLYHVAKNLDMIEIAA